MEHGKKAYGETHFKRQEAGDSADLCAFPA